MLQPQYSYKYGFPLDCIFDDTAQKVSYYYNTFHFIALLLYPNDVKLANILNVICQNKTCIIHDNTGSSAKIRYYLVLDAWTTMVLDHFQKISITSP